MAKACGPCPGVAGGKDSKSPLGSAAPENQARQPLPGKQGCIHPVSAIRRGGLLQDGDGQNPSRQAWSHSIVIVKIVQHYQRHGLAIGLSKMAGRLYVKLDPGLKIWVACRHLLNRCKYVALADPYAFIWVSPNQIVYHRRSFVPKWDLGKVVGGDWDKLEYFFDNLAKHKAIKARVELGLAWEETGIFEYLEHFIATRKRAIDGCRTRKDMLLRYNMIDDLIESVRLNGYVPNNTIDKKMDHICVNIGRYGDIIFNGGGHHRLSLAKLFGVPRVPVLVIVRHKRWQRHRDQIARGLAAGADLSHPDLAAFAGKSGLVPPQNT